MSLLNKEQFDLIKYCVVGGYNISDIRKHLRNKWGGPVFHPDISVKYLNRTVASNIKRSLLAHQKNPNGRSTFEPVSEGYSPYHEFRAADTLLPFFRELSREQFESQFALPEDVGKQENNMSVQFGHTLPHRNRNTSRQHGPRDTSTSLPRMSPSRTVPSPPRSASVHSVPPLPSVGPFPSATRVNISGQDENIIEPSGVLAQNKDANGKIFPTHYSCYLTQMGLGHVVFPGGSSIVFRYGSDQVVKDGRQHNALLVQVNHSFPLDTAMPVRYPAYIQSENTFVLPLPMGCNPESGSKLPEQMAYESERLGDNQNALNNSLQAMRTYMRAVGCGYTWVAITIKNLPHALSTCGSFQAKETLAINSKGLTPILDSNLYSAKDTTDENQVVYFNDTQ